MKTIEELEKAKEISEIEFIDKKQQDKEDEFIKIHIKELQNLEKEKKEYYSLRAFLFEIIENKKIRSEIIKFMEKNGKIWPKELNIDLIKWANLNGAEKKELEKWIKIIGLSDKEKARFYFEED